MLKLPVEPTGQQFTKTNLRITQVFDENKTLLVLALVISGKLIYRFYACKNRAEANTIVSYFPELFRKSYAIGDRLPKNIAAEVYHSVK